MIGWIAFWMALALVFGVAEAIGRTLRIVPFALASVAAAVAAWASLPVGAQWTIYAVVAAVLSIVALVVAGRLRL